MKKAVLVLTFVMLFAGLAPQSSQAVALSNTDVPIATLLSGLSSVMFYQDYFDFDPKTGPDGRLDSGVWTNGLGQYVYFYAIHVFANSSDYISGMTLDIGNHLVPYDFGTGVTTSFRDFVYFSTASASPSSASFFNGVIRWEFRDAAGDPLVAPGQNTWEFGFVADAPPQLIVANLLDSGGEASPITTSPVPEPGTMMLLGSGLVGLAGWGRKKFRK